MSDRKKPKTTAPSLTNKQVKALEALLIYPTRREACKSIGISETTLRRYLRDDVFVSEYKKAVEGLIADATRDAQITMPIAIKRLREILEDDDENRNVQISAARSVLEYGLRLTEFNDILTEIGERDVL